MVYRQTYEKPVLGNPMTTPKQHHVQLALLFRRPVQEWNVAKMADKVVNEPLPVKNSKNMDAAGKKLIQIELPIGEAKSRRHQTIG